VIEDGHRACPKPSRVYFRALSNPHGGMEHAGNVVNYDGPRLRCRHLAIRPVTGDKSKDRQATRGRKGQPTNQKWFHVASAPSSTSSQSSAPLPRKNAHVDLFRLNLRHPRPLDSCDTGGTRACRRNRKTRGRVQPHSNDFQTTRDTPCRGHLPSSRNATVSSADNHGAPRTTIEPRQATGPTNNNVRGFSAVQQIPRAQRRTNNPTTAQSGSLQLHASRPSLKRPAHPRYGKSDLQGLKWRP